MIKSICSIAKLFLKLTPLLVLGVSLMCVKCTVKKPIVDKIVPIEGQWELVAWYNDKPIDLNEDGKASKDLLNQWDDCYKYSTLILENNPFYYYNALFVYTGEDNPTSRPYLKHNDIRILSTRQYNPKEKTLDIIHKYYVDTYKIITLNDSILELETIGLVGYTIEGGPSYRGGVIKFRRLSKANEFDIRAMLEKEDRMPYLTIHGTVESVKKIEEGYAVKVKTYGESIYMATILKKNLNSKSIYKVFKVGEKIRVKGNTIHEENNNTMLVKTIYSTDKKD
jgi:hypothetical protein